MFYCAFVLLILSIAAGLLSRLSTSVTAFGIAKLLFIIFLVQLIVSIVMRGKATGSRSPCLTDPLSPKDPANGAVSGKNM